MSSYAKEEEEVDINDLDIEVGSLSDQESSEVLDRASKVRFEIKKAEVRTQHEDSKDKSTPWTVKRLSLQAKISEDGTDKEGANAGRVLFPEFILTFNQQEFPENYASDWWQKKARGPFKELIVALGYDPAAPPRIDKDFIDGLVGREFIADIKVAKIQEKTNEKNEKGKFIYKDTGDTKNELGNFRSI